MKLIGLGEKHQLAARRGHRVGWGIVPRRIRVPTFRQRHCVYSTALQAVHMWRTACTGCPELEV